MSALLRVRTCVKPIQCYSLAGDGRDAAVLDDISANPGLVRHFVLTSDVTGVFNFGGDLSLFVLLIRARDLDSLRMYGRRCIDLVWWLENAAQPAACTRPCWCRATRSAAGSSRCCRSTRSSSSAARRPVSRRCCSTCSPAWARGTSTIRKAGFAVANEMILSGRLYTAEQL